jgi:hypothetical protein
MEKKKSPPIVINRESLMALVHLFYNAGLRNGQTTNTLKAKPRGEEPDLFIIKRQHPVDYHSQ